MTRENLLDVFSKKRVMERASAWSDRGRRGVGKKTPVI